jgi:hypothetical protein
MSRSWTLRLSVLGLVAACLAIGYVAGRPGPSAPPATYLEQLTTALDLSPAQVAAIESILAEEDRVVDAMLTERLEEIRAPVAERREQTEHALLAQLDEEQREHYRLLAGQAAERR